MLSRVAGLAREMAYSYFFGTGPLLSAFVIAFMIPNLARRLFGEGALSAAFIPIFARTLKDKSNERAVRLAGGVLSLLGVVLLALIVVAEGGLLLSNAIHPSLAVRLTAVMLPFMWVICFAALLGGILNTLGHFAAPAVAPLILNVFVLITLIVGGKWFGLTDVPLVYAVGVSVLAAGAGQVVLQLVVLRRRRFPIRLNRDWKQPQIREMIALMAPMIVGVSTVQINSLLDKLIAWFFVPDGQGPAVLSYAHFLYQLPLGVFGISVATAIFPMLAGLAADGNWKGLTRAVERGVTLGWFIALPATVGLFLIAPPLVVALYEDGEFTPSSSIRVSLCVQFYTLGLGAYFVQHVFIRAFYAMKESRIPARVSVYCVLLDVVMNLAMVQRFGEAGVAFSTAFSAVVQTVWLALLLKRRLPTASYAGLAISLFKTTVVAAVMGLVVWLVVGDAGLAGRTNWHPGILVAIAVTLGCTAMLAAARALRIPELAELLARRSGITPTALDGPASA